MEKKSPTSHPDRWLNDLSETAQIEGFKPDEMISCPNCERKSPPTRMNCFYCNAELPFNETKLLKLNLRKLENWEKGFNVVSIGKDFDESKVDLAEASKFLSFDPQTARKILSSGKNLPLVRVETENEARIIGRRLAELGIETRIVSDESLKPETQQKRLRGIEFFDDALMLICFNADEVKQIKPDDLRLIVSGLLFESKIATSEKYNRKKENKFLDSSEISSDETMIDIYAGDEQTGFRIAAKGFDFSCLGTDKQLTAEENIKKLIEKLREFSRQTKFDDDYRILRGEIGMVWEVERRKDSKGVQKKMIGNVKLENVTTIDNLSQFTKYSRLQRQIL